MADSLPSPAKSSSPTRAEKVRRLLHKGFTAVEIAHRLAPNDPKKRRNIQRQIYRIQAQDEQYQAVQAMISQGMLVESLPGVTSALIKRAKRGRPDAIKLIYEASKFHNPKVNHEHSGEVKITLATMPRPALVETTDSVDSEAITEAEVVDE